MESWRQRIRKAVTGFLLNIDHWQEADEANEANEKRSFNRYFPSAVVQRLHAIGSSLDGLTAKQQSGESVQKLLESAGVSGLKWTHSKDAGSYATLHRTERVAESGSFKDEGILVIAVLPKGHRAPTHMHRSGKKGMNGEYTMVWQGSLTYRCYDKSEDACTASTGDLRISPDRSRDEYEVQDEMCVVIYWQPQPAQMAAQKSA